MPAAARGRAAGKSAKPWRDALRIAVNRETQDGDRRKVLDALAEATVQAALAGDIQAIKEIADRLDGKATQPISGDDEHDALTIKVVRFADDNASG